MREYIDINDIYPPFINTDNYIIYKKLYTQEAFDSSYNVSCPFDESMHYPISLIHKESFRKDINKIITVLHYKKENAGMMSNHLSEIETCNIFSDNARGDVLIFGLGLGIVVFPLLKDESIKSITIIEHDKSLIDVVGFFLSSQDVCCKLSIIHGDAFTHHRDLHEKYDTIWFDIWSRLERSTVDEIEYLHKVYKKNLKDENSLMLSWCYEEMKEYFKNNPQTKSV